MNSFIIIGSTCNTTSRFTLIKNMAMPRSFRKGYPLLTFRWKLTTKKHLSIDCQGSHSTQKKPSLIFLASRNLLNGTTYNSVQIAGLIQRSKIMPLLFFSLQTIWRRYLNAKSTTDLIFLVISVDCLMV